MIFMLAALATAIPPGPSQSVSSMATLYQQVCLRAFPDDKAVGALMTAQKARDLTQAEVTATMGQDPARGWMLPDGRATVWLEMPPYYACSVRWNASEIGDLHPYRTIVDEYENALVGFHSMAAEDADQGAIHIHLIGEQRPLPDKSSESLFVIDQRISDPKRRANGETGVVIRFVHQLSSPPATAK